MTPLIATPYVARTLTTTGVGKYSFSYSIVTYFMLFAALGFGYYAQREIAKNQGDKYKQSKTFYEIIIARFFSVIPALLLYFALYFLGIFGDYSVLMLVLSINIISTLFDITFFFQGNESFGIIVLVNTFVRILGIVLIFVFVRKPSDLWIYTLSQSIILILSYIILWLFLPKRICKVHLKDINFQRHFIPTLRLFIPTIAVSVYTMLDKTLIGLLVPGTTTDVNGEIQKISDIENGYYSEAEKLVKMALTIITSLGIVMIPRNSNAIANGNMEEFKTNIQNAIKFVFFLGIPIMFGLAAISLNVCPWFFGEGYEKVPYLIMLFCPLVLFIGLSNVLGIQYLLPQQMDGKYTISITVGALTNLILNIILIPFLWSYGACIATIAAEFSVMLMMLVFSRKDINILKEIIKNWKCILSGLLMFSSIYIIGRYLNSSIINTLILIICGSLIYFVLLLILREKYLFKILGNIRKRLSKKNR